MKAPDSSSSARRVHSVPVARALLDAGNLEIVKHLMRAELAAQPLAEALNLPLSKIHYRLRTLERLGIATCVRSQPRGGRAIRHYRILETHWFVPFELTSASTPSELIASSFRPLFERFLNRFGDLAERVTTPDAWGINIQLKDDDLSVELSPARPERHLTGPVLTHWIGKRVSREQGFAFEARLEALLAEFDALPEEASLPEQLLGVFLIEGADEARDHG
jgi:Helix-turn-helix domain